jgi:EAL domain-containing protein (putative c-di-GMP-specific phosphodiesterase class I)
MMALRGLQFELQRAITENELVLHYQPRVLLSTLELRGVEALVRWRHPVRGIVTPSEFVPAAERAGLIRDLEAWVIRETLLQAAVWRRDGLRSGVSVNITPSLLRDKPFLRLLERTLTIQGDPTTFIFEVPAAGLGGADRPIEALARLRARGVRLALDDVTSHAELEAASWIRWDYVKLGRALVTGAARDETSGATLRALADRAKALGAKVVGVGVEDDATIALLRDAGAYMAQGYAIAPPLGVKELLVWSEGRRRTD